MNLRPGSNARLSLWEAGMTEVMKYDAARVALEQATTVDEVKQVIAVANAMQMLAKEMKEERADTEAKARELKLRAERRLGEMIAQQPKAPAGNPNWVSKKPDSPITLDEAGIDKNLANRARKAAALDGHEFEEMILDVREGGGKKKRKPPPDEAKRQAIAVDMLDHGKTYKQVKAEYDVGYTAVRAALNTELGRRDVPIDPELLPKTAQEKLQRAIKQAVRKHEAEYEMRVQEGIKQAINETVLPHYNKKMDEFDEVIKSRKGVLTSDEFRLILSCLHPDQSSSPERLREAFNLFKSHELSLRGEKEMPTSSFVMPRNHADLMKMREEVRAKRKAQKNVSKNLPGMH
jgi:DNA-binding protein YbaB